MPGRRSTTRYWPDASVVTTRNFSMSAGLLASIVTPGSTAPVVSLTTPAIAPACCADTGTANASATTVTTPNVPVTVLVMSRPPTIANDHRRAGRGHNASHG